MGCGIAKPHFCEQVEDIFYLCVKFCVRANSGDSIYEYGRLTERLLILFTLCRHSSQMPSAP